MTNTPHPQPVHRATTRRRRIVSPVWSVPVIAAIIALYLGWRTLSEEGQVITITFNTADGIAAGQTQIKYKAVALGTVTEINLDSDHTHVIVRARMQRSARDLLTDKTRFWVVRPRLNYNLSGFETLVSGSYIQCDPGEKGGEQETHFTGLEEPPGIRADEPGTTFTLEARKLGSITNGSPVYFRDINVGDVLHYDIGEGYGPIRISIFVRAPFDKLVHQSTHFWSASGISFSFSPSGLQVQLQSIQALLVGGISFYTKKEDIGTPIADKNTAFRLYDNRQEAEIGNLQKRISYVTYFRNSVKNLEPGAPVYMYGIQIGEVTGVKLLFDPQTPDARVRVTFDIQPERAFQLSDQDLNNGLEITRRMVDSGFRVALDSGGLLPGMKGLAIERVQNPEKADVAMEGNAILMPSSASNDMIEALSEIAEKLNQIPFAQIGTNLNALLHHANGAVEGIGEKSDFQRDAKRTMDQVNDAARAIRLLADFLNRHPEALIRGRDMKEEGQ